MNRCTQYKALPESDRGALDLQLFELARQNFWKRCPGCQAMVQRISGCFYMSCSCGTRFCYDCGVKVIRKIGLFADFSWRPLDMYVRTEGLFSGMI